MNRVIAVAQAAAAVVVLIVGAAVAGIAVRVFMWSAGILTSGGC